MNKAEMSAYDLPTSVIIGGKEYAIRYTWRAVVDVLIACADPELDAEHKALCLIQIFYPEYQKIPTACLQEACRKASDFIDCGQFDDGKVKPKLIDWKKDAAIIIPEINKIVGREIRMDPGIHWWTFFGWFMGIGDGLFASVLHIRQKKAKRKKLEKWEQEFYAAHKDLVDFENPEKEEIRKEKDSILKWLRR